MLFKLLLALASGRLNQARGFSQILKKALPGFSQIGLKPIGIYFFGVGLKAVPLLTNLQLKLEAIDKRMNDKAILQP